MGAPSRSLGSRRAFQWYDGRAAGGAGQSCMPSRSLFFFFQAEDGIRDSSVTGVQTCALPIPSMLKRTSQDHPAFERFLSACGQVSGKLKHTLLACLAPPTVRTKARFMHVHRDRKSVV